MSGAHFRFTLDDKALRRELKATLSRMDDAEPFLKSIGEEMLPRITDRFKAEQGPDGKKWKSLAPRTVEHRLKKYGNSPLTILRMRGHLAGSVNYQVSGNRLSIGTGKEAEAYAGIHQFGGKAGRGRKVKITARPYLGFADDDMDIIEEELTSYLSG